jgi:hypothetical protein
MFTIKYRFYEPAPTPPDCTAAGFTPIEQISGPYESVSHSYEDGYAVVRANRGDLSPGMTYGPVIDSTPMDIAEYEKQSSLAGQALADVPRPLRNFPRPTLWVMNAQGATIAKYDL